MRSTFECLDPRVKLLWMFLISGVAISMREIVPSLVLIVTLIPVWILAKRVKLLLRSSGKLIPYLGFLFLIQLIVAGISRDEWLTIAAFHSAALEDLRFYVMIASAILLFQTTDFGEMTAAIRSFKKERAPQVWNKGLETIAFILGVGYQMVPILQREIERIVQVQRSRGVGVTEGNKIQQVKKLVRLGTPLFLRSLELAKSSALALINYAYTPSAQRTLYRRLKFNRLDWLALLITVGGSTCFLISF